MPNFRFVHNNINVIDLQASLDFYGKALGLKEVRRKEKPDFTLVYLGDGQGSHQLELTWLKNWPKEKYDLGDNEFHLALRQMIMRQLTPFTRKWAASAMKMPVWAFTS